jgi:hypothetical protein
MEEKRTDEAVKVAETLSPEGVDRAIGNLKAEIGRMLADISEKLAGEVGKYKSIQKAIESKERETLEKKNRDREKEEFTYLFKRDQQTMRDQFNDEKAKLEKENQQKREVLGQEMAAREQAVAAKESELAQFRNQVAAFPKELEKAINQAVQEATDRIKLEAKNREELQRKDFEGQRNVLTTKIE